jgi:hypothetical protein
MAKRSKQQNEALAAYLRAANRYDAHWQELTNVQFEALRNELNDTYKLMSSLVTIRVVGDKSEGITAAMRRTYPELLGEGS